MNWRQTVSDDKNLLRKCAAHTRATVVKCAVITALTTRDPCVYVYNSMVTARARSKPTSVWLLSNVVL